MAQSVEQWTPLPATPALCNVPIAVLPQLTAAALELDEAQRPERVSADRWTAPDANLVPALFSK
jgi:hypothetical protein